MGTLGWKSLNMLWVELRGPFKLGVRETRVPREMDGGGLAQEVSEGAWLRTGPGSICAALWPRI